MVRMKVNVVHALSGETITDEEVYSFDYVDTLKKKIEVSLGKPLQFMFSSAGEVISSHNTIGHVLRRSGETVSVLINTEKAVLDAASTENDLAIVRGNGSVEIPGRIAAPDLHPKFDNVRKIWASRCAFAVLRADDTVTSWGAPAYGGDCSQLQHELSDVKEVFATQSAFAA
jgi:hypothetical protein